MLYAFMGRNSLAQEITQLMQSKRVIDFFKDIRKKVKQAI